MKILRALCIALLFGISSCSKQTLPAWVSATPTAPDSLNIVSEIAIRPVAVFGGQSAEGSITVQLPASRSTTVSLSSSDPAVSVPGSVTIAEGATSATFPITTSAVARDTLSTITARLSDVPKLTTLMAWPQISNSSQSLWYVRDSLGTYARHTSETVNFAASCTGTTLDIRVNLLELRMIFSWPGYGPKRGTYDVRAPGPGPGGLPAVFGLGGNGVPVLCRTGLVAGTFTIDDIDIPANGQVRRFAARYDIRCVSTEETFRGEVRLTNTQPLFGTATCTQ